MSANGSDPSAEKPAFKRAIGLWSATAINMTQMCGIGPFVTIPAVVAAMGGPQAILGWIVGAIIVIADGLIWAELGAAMPGAGGTYLYLREAFQYRTGRLMPFLFIWTAIIAIPLIMSTGVIGLVKYLGFYLPNTPLTVAAADKMATAAGVTPPDTGLAGFMHNVFAVTPWGAAISLVTVIVVVLALYRKITVIEKITNVLWVVMVVSVIGVIIACFTHFNAKLAFTFPSDAFQFSGKFFMGLGSALVLAIYDYLGYNTTAYMAGELKDPGRVIPKSIIYSIVVMMVIYLVMNIGIMGVLPWKDTVDSDHVGSDALVITWGTRAAQIFTSLIIVTAFGSLFTGLLGGSRVPYHAAKDRLFFPAFGRLHQRLNFPHFALLFMGVVTAIGALFSLNQVINMLIAVMIPLQALAQIAALTTLRKRQPTLPRPYKMILYPLPSILALIGWLYVYYSSGWTFNDDYPFTLRNFLLCPGTLSIYWLIFGVIAFLVWAKIEKTWPFGPKVIREEFLHGIPKETSV